MIANGDDMLIARLEALLVEVRTRAGADFTGVGVIVASDPVGLPIAALRPARPVRDGSPAVDLLTAVSRTESPYHDGFHVLSPALDVLLLSQFFAPAIVPGILLEGSANAGARHAAALFGSAVPGVVATGLATSMYGVAVFRAGARVGRA